MANDVIDRDATCMGIAPIPKCRGHAAVARNEGGDQVVKLSGRHTGHDVRHQHIKRFRSKASGAAHSFKGALVMKFDRAGAAQRRIFCHSQIFGHADSIARCTGLCEGARLGYAVRMNERIWTAALVVIGDEILSGRTQDRNIAQIAVWLNVQGIRLAEVRVVPDVEAAIIEAVNHLRLRNDYLFTTGGIGPTHDDITVDAIAAALGVGVVHHPKALAALGGYYTERGGLTAARKRMARVPEGADLIENRMSGAPGIRIGNIFLMAGGAAHHRRDARCADGDAGGRSPGSVWHHRLLGGRKRSC